MDEPAEQDPKAGRAMGASTSGTPIRGRGGFRSELRTIPINIQVVRPKQPEGKMVEVLANYVEIQPMQGRIVHMYRIDYEPELESLSLMRKLFYKAADQKFSKRPIYDDVHECRSGEQLPEKVTRVALPDPGDPSKSYTVIITNTGTATFGPEMLRTYNMQMKQFLRALGFYQAQPRCYVHPAHSTPIGDRIMMLRGYATSANMHEDNKVLMNLEAVHKIVQRRNVLDIMQEIRHRGGNFLESARAELVGKLVITNYNNRCYRIEDVNITIKPTSTFTNKRDGRQISYVSYFQEAHGHTIRDQNQPLLVVVPNNQRKGEAGGADDQGAIHLIPEMCNIAGLTEQQRTDNRLKMDLIRASQVIPNDRVNHMRTFLQQFHNNAMIRATLQSWGYSYDTKPVFVQAHVLRVTRVGLAQTASKPMNLWQAVNEVTGDFIVKNLAVTPRLSKMVVLIGRRDLPNKGPIMNRLKQGFDTVCLHPGSVQVIDMNEGDGPMHYANQLRRLPSDTTAAIVVMNAQNKERYDAIKKLASVERGLITQVVTARLMMDDRKASGAATKIAIQIAAKIGGEPWLVDLPLKKAMVCGYDTHHDTTKRGRSFGAFLASMNDKFSSWFSKADVHDRIDEMSSQIATNIVEAFNAYKKINNQYPERVIIYRDGVSDGQIEHVYNVELQKIITEVKNIQRNVALTMIIVNKRIGARFYMRTQQGYNNPPPGTVIDNVVTRRERYDFYLISQSTRQGTVSPTYYNIIHDESGLSPERHQIMAFKLCFLYYNWSGSVRVPAPCQYAHKLAFLCGEHLHDSPNANLNSKLHFL